MKTLTDMISDSKFEKMHIINEMATMSRPSDKLPKSAKVCIYGEDDEPGTKEPHFHVIIDNGEIELEISLRHVHELNIWRTKRNYPLSWDGLTNVKKAIHKWLDNKSAVDKTKTNLELMIIVWNLNNPTNEIDNEFVVQLQMIGHSYKGYYVRFWS